MPNRPTRFGLFGGFWLRFFCGAFDVVFNLMSLLLSIQQKRQKKHQNKTQSRAKRRGGFFAAISHAHYASFSSVFKQKDDVKTPKNGQLSTRTATKKRKKKDNNRDRKSNRDEQNSVTRSAYVGESGRPLFASHGGYR